MNPRFEKFEDTKVFMYYGQYVFENDINIDRLDEYEKYVHNFRLAFDVEYEIDNDEQVLTYIEKYEDEDSINEENLYDFIVFCKIILEKLFNIIGVLKGTKTKLVVHTTKQTLKNMEQDQKRMERDLRTREKDELKRQEQEARRLLRDQKDEALRKEREDKQLLRKQNELQKELQKQEQKQLEQQQKILLKQEKERESAEKERLEQQQKILLKQEKRYYN
jgi:hypothetical protein